jgi:hypothetical protein
VVLAGVPVADADVLTLARLVRGAGFVETASRLEDAWDMQVRVLGLTLEEREEILRALEEAADGLAELRGVLIRDREARIASGLQ